MDLFGGSTSKGPSTKRFDLPDAEVLLLPGFLGQAAADTLLDRLLHGVDWRQDTVVVFGKRHPQPRLTQWFGPPGHTYSYSGVDMQPIAWPAWLKACKHQVESASGATYNSVLANLYRNGQDTVGWHADNEPELGHQPHIASLSLGAVRDFRLKHRTRRDVDPVTVNLGHGDLLLMAGNTQHAWLHTVPRRAGVSQPRVNLTFRHLIA